MKPKKTTAILLVVLILMTGVYGCAMNNNVNLNETNSASSSEETTLTERQKSILAEMGLSTEYDDLTYTQKEAIAAIEEMLTYADKKYAMTFCYAGYMAAFPGVNGEYMYAYPEGGDDELDVFKIRTTDDGYKDNYIAVASRYLYAEYVHSGIQEYLPETEILVYAHITDTTLESIPESGEEFEDTTGAGIDIFVDGAFCSEEEYEDFIRSCSEYLNDHKLYSSVDVFLLDAGQIKYVTEYNYTDYRGDDSTYLKWEYFNVNE